MSTSHCTNHCLTCGRHFHSLEAFDAHRSGDHRAPLGSETGRRCLAPIECLDTLGELRLETLAEDAICELGDTDLEIGATVWVLAGSRQRAQVSFHGRARSVQAA